MLKLQLRQLLQHETIRETFLRHNIDYEFELNNCNGSFTLANLSENAHLVSAVTKQYSPSSKTYVS